jgi:catechol 2,3-dioxygenase-like lactoylglutathione lyase family enzyme
MLMLNSIDIDIISGLIGFIIGFFPVLFIIKWPRHQEKKSNSSSSKINTEYDELLHWNPLEERRGLGNLLTKVNHIAITVSDVGKSLSFYVDILGLQQIRRPTFDRHGAWLTMGNTELHLIKGIPAIPPVDNLQVAHIALETSDVNGVLHKLRELNIEVCQSLSVTNAQKSSTDESQSEIVQYFFTDPDGYYLELCNCDILTKFALNKNQTTDHIQYYEGIPNDKKFDIAQTVLHWKTKVEKHCTEQIDDILQTITPATEIDEDKFNNLVKRRDIYGDIMQGFSDEDIKEVLLKTNNFVPLAIKILTDKRGEEKFFQPSEFIENEELTKPEAFLMNQNDLN